MKKLLFAGSSPFFGGPGKRSPLAGSELAPAKGDSLFGIGNFEEALGLAQATEQKVLEQAGKTQTQYADCLTCCTGSARKVANTHWRNSI